MGPCGPIGGSVMKQEDYQLYGLTMGLLHRPLVNFPDDGWLEEVRVNTPFLHWPFAQPDNVLLRKLTDAIEIESQQSLKRDYYRLFIGPGAMAAPPFGSVYTDKDNLLFGETSIAFLNFCKSHDIELHTEDGEANDHIGLMLGLLSHLLQHRPDLVCTYLGEHLLPWSARLFELVRKEAVTEFYRNLAELCQITLNQLAHSLAIKPIHRQLYY